MAVYVPIPDIEIAPESPVTSVLMHKLRDNPLSISEGDITAPPVSFKAIGVAQGAVPASYREDMVNVIVDTSHKVGTGVICGGVTGTINVRFSMLKAATTGIIYGQLKFNGVNFGEEFFSINDYKTEFIQSFTLTGQGIIELWCHFTGGAGINLAGELGVYTNGSLHFTRENLNAGIT